MTSSQRVAVLTVTVALCVAPGVGPQTAVETARTIRVVMDGSYAPYVFQSGDGKLQGILIDQWQAWEKKTGIKAEIHAMDWAEALRRMRAGEFDVIDCIVETAERRQYFDFTPGYAAVDASIFFRDDISGITDLASLKGFPVGVKAGDQHIDRLAESGVTTVISFQNNDAIIEAARQHKINVFVVDAPSALYLLNKMDMDEQFRNTAPIFRDELRRAVRKGDAALLRTVSAGFAAIEPDQLKQIDEKWFGRTINRYPRYLTYAGYTAGVALLLIAGLVVWNRALRERILQRTAALGESEQRFRQIAENIHEVFWLIDVVKQTLLYVSPGYEAVWGRSRESLYREPRSFFTAIHPADSPSVAATFERGHEQSFEMEYRVVRPDGSIRWIWNRGFPIRDESGRFYRLAGIAEDITGRKQAQEKLQHSESQLRALSAKLQSAREEEATRIAREIHDELGQALTAVRLELTALLRHLPADEGPTGERSRSIVKLLDEAIHSIRRIATELRPGILDDLGLVAAVEWVAEEFEARTGTTVQVSLPDIDIAMDRACLTALFRILQETLTNIARHANATHVRVRLAAEDGMLTLEVHDNGHGITAEQLAGRNSLGILGMRERALLLGGELVIDGVPGVGTTVRVRIPDAGEGSPCK
jgi:PAS domain S-box-containing protein